MKRIFSLFTVLAVAVFVLNGFVVKAAKQDSFWMKAAQGGMAEVMMGNLALQKSQNEEVRRFAQMMVDDHTMANDELKPLAASKSVTLPTDVSSKHKSMTDKLNGMSDMNFDREYMKGQVKDHESMVKLFQKQANSGDADAEAKAFAAKTLPKLQEHLTMARTMYDGMKNMKSGGNMNSNSNSNMNMNSNNNVNGL